jgi:hypothetical protein
MAASRLQPFSVEAGYGGVSGASMFQSYEEVSTVAMHTCEGETEGGLFCGTSRLLRADMVII